MTYRDIADMVAEPGVPTAYYQFPENTGRQPPFICFYFLSGSDVLADDGQYVKVDALMVELYTSEKDFELEAECEAALKRHGLVFTWQETYIESEKMHLKTYYTEVIINAE